MKTKRFLLAAALLVAAAGCAREVTSPDPSLRAPDATRHDAAPAPEEGSSSTTAAPPEEDPGDSGSTGAGCCIIAPAGGG